MKSWKERKDDLSLNEYPGLFDAEPGKYKTVSKGAFVPEASIYDEQVPSQKRPSPIAHHRVVTVFGYTPGNLDAVLRQFKAYGGISDINYGKNWVDIKYDREKSMFRALADNGAVLNGEMIGVMQKNRKDGAAVRSVQESLFVQKEPGAVGRLLMYLFGEQ